MPRASSRAGDTSCSCSTREDARYAIDGRLPRSPRPMRVRHTCDC
jgi:hypothetical protein